jgi:hypothetical protein
LRLPEERFVARRSYATVPVAESLQAVPAVPVEHIETYGGPEIAVAPAPVAAPVYAAAPAHGIVEAVPSPATSSQYHAQDEFGNVAYGYNNPNSAKEERRDAHGNVVGQYSYVDASGVPKYLSYIADDYGFRVTSTNALPLPPLHPAH